MAVRATHKRLSGGTDHEHIIRLWWTDESTGKSGNGTRAELVAWIENEKGQIYVKGPSGDRAEVGVVTPSYGEKYLRTHADGEWNNNLLSLPNA